MKKVHLSPLLSLALLLPATLSGCGSVATKNETPAAPSSGTPAPVAGAGSRTVLEALAGHLEALDVAELGRLRDAVMVGDAAATGGEAAGLYNTGSSVRFDVPSGGTNLMVSVQARAVTGGGNPILVLRRGTQTLAKVTVSSTAYAAYSFGSFSLSAGDHLSVRLTNGDGTDAHAALVDYLNIDPVTGTSATPTPAPAPAPTLAPGTAIKLPPAGKVAWDWQIGASRDSDLTVPTGVKLLDVDGFNTSAVRVGTLKAAGVYTVCYLDVGSYEPGRPDSAQYPDYLKIQQDPDWPQEYFLDVTDVFRSGSVLATILNGRFQMCQDKGFDAVEPDNLQNDENVSGGQITTQQQIDFNGWVADQVHAHGMAVLQKNGPDKVLLKDRTGKMMVEKFDGILNEECQQYSECGPLAEYVRRGKLALNAEYSVAPDCTLSAQLNINTIRKDLALVGGTTSGYRREACN